MKLSGLKDIAVDWFKSCHRFGSIFTNEVSARINASPKQARIGGGIFDAAAGIGLSYLGVSGIVGNTLAIGFAAMTVVSAPLHALVTIPVSTVFIALGVMMTGMGLGFLNGARQKAGLPGFSDLKSRAQTAVSESASSQPKSQFKPGSGLISKFKRKADKSKPTAPAGQAPKAVPVAGDYKL